MKSMVWLTGIAFSTALSVGCAGQHKHEAVATLDPEFALTNDDQASNAPTTQPTADAAPIAIPAAPETESAPVATADSNDNQPTADATPVAIPPAPETESTPAPVASLDSDDNAQSTVVNIAPASTQPTASDATPSTQPAVSIVPRFQEIDRGPEPQVQPDPHFAAGQQEELAGNQQCALVHYTQALILSPHHVPSLYRMGVVLTKQKKYTEAVAMWQRYIEATGNVASGYSNLGFTYEMAADVPNAEAAYKQGLDIDPKDKSCRVNYGLMLARQNRSEEGKEQLAQVMSPAEVSFNLATIFTQQGALARAKEELRNAIAADPNMKEAQDKLATLPQD